jgi:hypothetical protein
MENPKFEADLELLKKTAKTGLVLEMVISGLVLAVAGILIYSTIMVQKSFEKMSDKLDAIEESMIEQFGLQKTAFYEKEEEIAEELKEVFREYIQESTQTTGWRIDGTDARIRETEKVYASILEEQKKKTVESVYSDTELRAQYDNAANLFREQKYRQANEIFELVAKEQPENRDARFYQFYSLFLMNKMDRDQYKTVKEGFSLLEGTGYMRNEMKEVLSFIGAEEKGIEQYDE